MTAVYENYDRRSAEFGPELGHLTRENLATFNDNHVVPLEHWPEIKLMLNINTNPVLNAPFLSIRFIKDQLNDSEQ